jgi:type I restriction enzyme R subunit
MLDKLSALIAAMNERYGADLNDSDRVWVDEQWVVVKSDDDMRGVALNNDRSQYELVLAEKIKQLLVERHSKNGALFDLFFANPDFHTMMLDFLTGTYDEVRRELAS